VRGPCREAWLRYHAASARHWQVPNSTANHFQLKSSSTICSALPCSCRSLSLVFARIGPSPALALLLPLSQIDPYASQSICCRPDGDTRSLVVSEWLLQAVSHWPALQTPARSIASHHIQYASCSSVGAKYIRFTLPTDEGSIHISKSFLRISDRVLSQLSASPKCCKISKYRTPSCRLAWSHKASTIYKPIWIIYKYPTMVLPPLRCSKNQHPSRRFWVEGHTCHDQSLMLQTSSTSTTRVRMATHPEAWRH
jgi:hypothetical protein